MEGHESDNIHEITAAPDNIRSYFRKIGQYKSLIWVFARRDLKVKYAQTWLGISWSILQPLVPFVIFSIFFGYILNWKSGDIPFALYILSGLTGWNLFTYIVNAGANSIQESSQLIKKIYFPKSILPLSKVLVGLIDLLISFLLLIPLIIYYQQALSWKIVFIPFVIFFNVLCGLAIVFWTSVFAYRKRDLFLVLPFIIQFGIWLTPVFYTDDFLPPNLQFIVDFNPMASVVNLWRWMLFGQTDFQWIWVCNFIFIFLLCVSGMYYYNRKESAFSDFV